MLPAAAAAALLTESGNCRCKRGGNINRFAPAQLASETTVWFSKLRTCA